MKSVEPLLRCRDKTEVDGVGWAPVRRLAFGQNPAFSILQLVLACGVAGWGKLPIRDLLNMSAHPKSPACA